MSCKCKYSL